MEFDYEIVYRPGRVHQVPDALSRLTLPDYEIDDEVDDEIPTFEFKPLTPSNRTFRRNSFRRSRHGGKREELPTRSPNERRTNGTAVHETDRMRKTRITSLRTTRRMNIRSHMP
jgi:hypothetical protein